MNLDFSRDLPFLENEFENAVWDETTGMDAASLQNALAAFVKENRSLPMPILRAKALAFTLENAQLSFNPATPFSVKPNLGISYAGAAGQDLFARTLYYPIRAEVLSEKEPELWSALGVLGRIGAGASDIDYWHTVPDWERLLRLGFPGQLVEAEAARDRALADGTMTESRRLFWEGVILSLKAVLAFFERVYQNSLRYPIPDFSEALSNLIKRPPETLYEVMLFSTLYLYVEEIGVERGRSLGPIDRLYLPCYLHDLETGALTKDEAAELFRYYFIHFSAAKRFAAQPLTLGGADENGVPFANELTDLILDVYGSMDVVNPKIHFRYHPNLPAHLLTKVLTLIRAGKSGICVLNDEVIIAGYERLGIPKRDAVRYVLLGCYEPVIMGKEEAEIGDCWMNIAKAAELVFRSGRDKFTGLSFGPETPEDFTDFEDFFAAALRQIDFITDTSMALCERQRAYVNEINPSLLYSASFAQCIEKGEDVHSAPMDYNNSSIKCYGFGTLIDSLSVVKKFVFDEKKLTFAELKKALDDNWTGHELLRAEIRSDPDKYGNGAPLPDELLRRVFDHITDRIVGRPNTRGGVWRFGMDSITNNLYIGTLTAATPDGRRDHEEISKNLCATNGMDRNGVTGLMASLLNIDQTKAIDSAILDFIVHPSAVEGEKGLEAFRDLVRTYFSAGGFAVQGNMVSGETLRDAQAHPERYRNLQIRVCGWNEYFTSMSKGMQDMFIRQTAGSV